MQKMSKGTTSLDGDGLVEKAFDRETCLNVNSMWLVSSKWNGSLMMISSLNWGFGSWYWTVM